MSRAVPSEWCNHVSPASFNVTGTPGTSSPFWLRDDYKCFNCGERCGQPLDKCPKPRNEANIEKNRKAHQAAKAAAGKGKRPGQGKRKRIIAKTGKFQGRPLILNKKGACVLDSKRDKAMKDEKAAKDEKDSDLQTIRQYFNEHKIDDDDDANEDSSSSKKVSFATVRDLVLNKL